MGNKITRKATVWLLVLFVVFCFAPFSSSADDGARAERSVTGTIQAAKKAVSSVIGDVEPTPVSDSGYDAHFFIRYDSSTQTEDGTTQYSPKHSYTVLKCSCSASVLVSVSKESYRFTFPPVIIFSAPGTYATLVSTLPSAEV